MRRFFITLVRQEEGIALMVALIIIFVLSSLCLTLLSLTTSHARLSWSYRDEAQALYLAESGFEEAIWKLNRGEVFKTAAEHLVVIGTDTLGSYQYWLKSGVADTLFAVGYIPNKKRARLRKQIAKIIQRSSNDGKHKNNHQKSKDRMG